MLSFLELRPCLSVCFSTCGGKLFMDIVDCFFTVSSNTTTRGLSRYSDYSLRSIFRFLSRGHDWVTFRVSFFKKFLFASDGVYIMAVDETVEGKSGRHSFGLSRFYSSIEQQATPAICFFAIGVVNVDTKVFSMLGIGQVVYDEADKARIKAEKEAKAASAKRAKEGKRKPSGRPAGQGNKPKEENPTRQYKTFKSLFSDVMGGMARFGLSGVVRLLVADSAYGTLDYYRLAEEQGLDLLSKFRGNASLWLPYKGEEKGGRPTVYGDKVDMAALPKEKLVAVVERDGQRVEYYQFEAYAKNCFGKKLLNIVVAKATRLSDSHVSTNIWFSTSLVLTHDNMLGYYGLRFQIEFDFRDAKQHFGLSSFKNYKKENLTNFVNLSFSMCLLSKAMLQKTRQQMNNPNISIQDLKLIYKARYTAKNIFKLVQKSTVSIFNEDFCKTYIPEDLINAA